MRALPANYLRGYSSDLIGWYQRHPKIIKLYRRMAPDANRGHSRVQL